jgi:hypothetical protein
MRSKLGQQAKFAVCIDNSGYAASLEVGKLYRVIPDQEASKHGYTRVIDESGEDYGYSAERFLLLKVPRLVAQALSGGPNRRTDRPSKFPQWAAQIERRGIIRSKRLKRAR